MARIVDRETRALVWDKAGGICHYCGRPMHPFRNFTVDHVVSRKAGGNDDLANLVGACRSCNGSKAEINVTSYQSLRIDPDAVRAFSVRLRDVREERIMSQTEIAARIGVTRAAMSAWELGKHRPRPSQLRALAAVLNVPAEWLVTGSMPTDSDRPRDGGAGAGG